jgi:hypothetical protein
VQFFSSACFLFDLLTKAGEILKKADRLHQRSLSPQTGYLNAAIQILQKAGAASAMICVNSMVLEATTTILTFLKASMRDSLLAALTKNTLLEYIVIML